MTSSQSKPWPFSQQDGYRIYQSGHHKSGTFQRIYVPETATQPEAKLRPILYLHGFALCMPSFYETHLIELVKEGYIVFFPDFQRSDYPDTLPTDLLVTRAEDIQHFRHWLSIATQLPSQGDDRLSASETPSLYGNAPQQKEMPLGPGLQKPKVSDVRRVAWALVIIIGILKLLSWFRRDYGKNLIHLLSTVGISLFHFPTEWLANAISLPEAAWERLSQDFPHWATEKMEVHAFGHSLGGLMALSLPDGFKGRQDQRFFPQQIVTADPAPSTEMGIPGPAIWLLKLFNSPFTQKPVLISETGKSLNIPVVILHGGADNIVKPQQWVGQTGDTPSNYDAIASQEKAIYFSYSNPEPQPPLVAFHNQAVTSTQYYGDGLFKNFGGVKDGPNAYNYEYVWPGLNFIFTGQATPRTLLAKLLELRPRKFDIKPVPPEAPRSSWGWIIGLLLLAGIVYWGWPLVH
ncbi:hypothetical protein C1752_01152 [Acaryochloris thomasi RCC1774]|uniref:Uncharacterized protein n=1 Tax=Acaryochloris thomasi RCC1774 TaxID=1764569 RepID=A0A2W1JWX7_9CYAN|nr:hypothetical protein [Acaryochloris thomasi]PZD74144.1 hypothetical protein C1752_01152 [Acaryochloris thomasi RCC1774]